MATTELAVIGVPTSAGTHHAGQDKAPAALRGAGLLDALRAGGLTVTDHGDLPAEVFAVDHDSPSNRNLAAVVRVAEAVADAVADVVGRGVIPLVIGGDCTISLGVVAGVQRHGPDIGVFYFDGDADLATPESTSSGVLDAMGVAHLIGLADTELARLGPTWPMLDDRRLVLVGTDESDPETFRRAALDGRPELRRFADHQVRADPGGCARAALEQLDDLVLHFDVDAVDSGDLPLANFPHYGTGVPLAAAGEVLRTAAAAPGLTAIVLTEVNPTYDPGGRQLARYVETVAAAISAGRVSAGRAGV